MKSRASLEINLELLKKNANLLKKINGDSFFCPMLKANAYGHGSASIAKALWEAGIKTLGILTVEEAESINNFIPEMDILIFSPLISKEDLSFIVEKKLIPVCSNWGDLENLAQLQKKIRIHLKFDTGFSRLGFKTDQAEKLLEFLKNHAFLHLEGIASHLVSGEELEDKNSFSKIQLQGFLNLTKYFPQAKKHLLNSSALISQFIHENSGNQSAKLNLGARPGISLYGIKPQVFFQNQSAKDKWKELNLQTVSCLKSQIVALQDLKKGDVVSYGACWKASRKTKIAVVSLGYADGFFRALGKKREVLFRGQKANVVGTVCMDFFMIDVTDIKEEKPLKLGEEVLIFGTDKLTVEDQAKAVKTIPYELFTSLGPRVKRVYTKTRGEDH